MLMLQAVTLKLSKFIFYPLEKVINIIIIIFYMIIKLQIG